MVTDRVLRCYIFVAFFLFRAAICSAQTQPVPVLDPGSPTDFISVLLPTRDGKFLIAAAADKTVRILDASTVKTTKIWRLSVAAGQEGELYAASLSPDEQWLAIGGNIGPAKDGILIFNWQNGTIKKRFKANGNGVRSLAWSPDGKSLFSGGKDNLVRVFETEGFQEIAQLSGHENPVRCLGISPDGKALVSSALDENIRLWQRGRKGWQESASKILVGHTQMVENTVFSPDGKYILSTGEDGRVLRWTANGTFEREVFTNHSSILDQNNQARQVVFSPSGKQWAVAETLLKQQGTTIKVLFNVQIFDEKGSQKSSFTAHKQTIFQVRFINENTLVSSDGANNVFLWNADGSTQLSLPAQSAMIPHVAFADGLLTDFALIADISNGDQLNCSFDWDRLRLTPDIGGRNAKRQPLKEDLNGKRLSQADDYHLKIGTGAIISSEQSANGRINRFTFTPDGNILVLFEKALGLYSPEGVLLRDFKGLGAGNRGLALTSDGQFAIVSTLTGGLQQLWHLPSGQLCATLFVRITDKEWVCWSPEGWFAASPQGGKMLNWYEPAGDVFFQEVNHQEAIRQTFNQPERLKKSITEKRIPTLVKDSLSNRKASAQPELMLSTGHGTAIEEIAFSPDGSRVATAGDDNFLKIWDLKTGKLFTDILNADDPSVSGSKTVQFSRDGRSVLTVQSGSDALCRYNAQTGERLSLIPAPLEMLVKARFSPDETRALTTSNPRKAVGLWDLSIGKERKIADLPGVASIADDVAFTPDGLQIMAVCRDRNVLFWEAKTQKLLKKLQLTLPPGDRDGLNFMELRISPDGRFFAVADGEAGIIWLGDCAAKTAEPIRRTAVNQIASAIGFSPDSRQLAIAGIGIPFELIDVKTRRSVQILTDNLPAQSLVFSPDGQYIAVVSGILHEFKVELWSIAQNKAVLELNRTIPLPKCVGISRSGRLFATGNTNNNVTLWDLSTGQYLFDLEGTPAKSHYDFGIQSIRFSPDERLVAAASADGNVYLWETASGKLRHRFTGHAGMVTCLDFSPDGTTLASGDLNKNVFLWDATSGKRIRNLPRHSAPVTTICFSPDSRRVVYGNYDSLRVCGVDGAQLAVFNPGLRNLIEAGLVDSLRKGLNIGHINKDLSSAVNELWARKISACFGTDNRSLLFAGGDDYQIGRFDIETRKKSFLKKPVSIFAPVTAMAVSPDGRFVALCLRQSGNVDIFNAKTGELLRSVAASKTTPFGLTFAQDGNRSLLATCADDGYAKLFDWQKSNAPLASFVVDREGHFTIVGADNYFFNDRRGVTSMAYKLDGQIYPFEQFDLRFNRPDLVLGSIGLAAPALISTYRNAWKKRLEKTGFLESNLTDDLHLPTLEVVNRGVLPLTTDKKTITLRLRAADGKFPLDRILVAINDVPMDGKNGKAIRQLNTKKWENDLLLELSAGTNKIQVSVVNSKAVESLRQTFYVARKASLPEKKPTLHLVLLSASKYEQSNMNLQYPVKDARDLCRAFVEKQGQHYQRIVVDSFFNQNLKRECLPEIKKRLLKTQVDDRVIVLVGGHGLMGADTNFYFATWDVDFRRPQDRGIAFDDLDELLAGIPARQKLMLLDACNAGEIDKNNTRSDTVIETKVGKVSFRSSSGAQVFRPQTVGPINAFDLMKELFVDLRRGSGATIVAGAGGFEFALEGDLWQNSVFIYALLAGLRNEAADLDKNGVIQVSELQQHLAGVIYELTGGRQRPVSRLENVINDFSIWENK